MRMVSEFQANIYQLHHQSVQKFKKVSIWSMPELNFKSNVVVRIPIMEKIKKSVTAWTI